MVEPIKNLRQMSLADLEKEYDRHAQHTMVGTSFYRQEIEWRYQSEHSERIEASTQKVEEMTLTIKRLTWVIGLLTLASTIATVASLLR
jgi:hypothetical protein